MLLTAFTSAHKINHIRETAPSLAAVGEMPGVIYVWFSEIDRTTTH